jgi:hypothetical protein
MRQRKGTNCFLIGRYSASESPASLTAAPPTSTPIPLHIYAEPATVEAEAMPKPVAISKFGRGTLARKPAPEEQTCGYKTTCRQMDSCAEAQHYLNQCGVSRLDRDGDGVPCESICG